MNMVKRFWREEDGPTATEYAVMMALILLVCIATIKALGARTNSAFDLVAQEVDNVVQ